MAIYKKEIKRTMVNMKILPDITYSLWTTILLKRPLYEDLIKDSPGRVVCSSREQGRRIKFVFLFVCFLRFVCFMFILNKMGMMMRGQCLLYESKADAIKFFSASGDKSDAG